MNRREELHYEWKVRGWDDRQLLECIRRVPRTIEYEFAYDEYQRRERNGLTIGKKQKDATVSDDSRVDGLKPGLRETYWITKALGTVTLATMQSKLRLKERATHDRLRAGVKAGFLRCEMEKSPLTNQTKHLYIFNEGE